MFKFVVLLFFCFLLQMQMQGVNADHNAVQDDIPGYISQNQVKI